ncbi:MAG TPA: hypothetical protein VG406_24340 [Isosphaeraceae bacterium]|jgi:hypothetical protein|nr:hypothetical protein [Isosphaeraceae bacterium]
MANTIGVLLLAAATASGGIFGKAHVGGKKFLRAHAVQDGPPPPGGPLSPMGNGMGMNPADCPPGMGMMGGAGMMGGMGQPGRRFPNTRSQIFFVDPPGMKIGWQTSSPTGEKMYLPAQLTVPARYNFNQGFIYRLKLTDIPGHPGLVLYPTIEVAPSTPVTDAYVTHNAIPAIFEEADFDQIKAGNFVTKVIYLPDPKYQELAIQGVETLVSTRLEPGVDPILEADRRGTILMILRVGAIDLEMPGAGAMAPNMNVAMPGAAGTATVLPPGSLPPGVNPFVPRVVPTPAPTLPESVPVDTAPVSPAPANVPPPPEAETPPAQPAPGEAMPAEEPKPAPGDAQPAAPPPAEPPAEAPKPEG